MSKSETTATAMNNSNCVAQNERPITFSDVIAEVERRFQIEKDCKNKAYNFILQMGLLDEFQKFSQATQGQNHFANCLTFKTT